MKKFISGLAMIVFSLAVGATQTNEVNTFNANMAVKLINAVLDCSQRQPEFGYSVAVVNREGNLMAFKRQDDALAGTIERSMGVARTAAMLNRSTSELSLNLNRGPFQYGTINAPGMVAIIGGVPIRENGKLIGGIGVAVSHERLGEEVCANEALKTFGYNQ